MRVSAGAKRRARNNGWIHVHSHGAGISNYSAHVVVREHTAQLAPIEVRDGIYRQLLRISPSIRYRRELINGPHGLASRGLGERGLTYGALPPNRRDRVRLAKSLQSFAKAVFPKYANLTGIPGIWQDEKGFPQIWKPRDYRMPMLLVPYKDWYGRIQACQLRLHREDLSTDTPKKYRWLSSPNEPHGCSSSTPIHFTFDPGSLPQGSEVVITEGALKADTLVTFRPGVFAIATSGVSCSHRELVAATRHYNVLIGFDTDYQTKPAVCMQLAALIGARELDRLRHCLSYTTKVLSWEGYNGIDEAVLHGTQIKAISTRQWFASLSADSSSEAVRIWRGMQLHESYSCMVSVSDVDL